MFAQELLPGAGFVWGQKLFGVGRATWSQYTGELVLGQIC